MLPKPEDGLQILGATIRAARNARGLTQQRAAREAKISRAQLALLEQGGNVSVKFLLKIARYLGLEDIPLDGTVRITTGQGALNVFEILRTLEVMGSLVDHARAAAVDAILPAAQSAGLHDTPVLKEFVGRHAADERGLERLHEALLQLSNETPPSAPPRNVDVPARPRRRRGAGQ